MNKFIFIVCTHRSGSTLLKNIIDANSNVVMLSDEPNISDPWHFTFLNHLNKIGDLKQDRNIFALTDLLKSGKIYSTFWENLALEEHFDFKNLNNLFLNSDRSHKSIFTIILNEYKSFRNKSIVGAKYPVHPKHINLLYEWYPNAKYIFLSRNIFASATSRLNDKATIGRKRKFFLLSSLIHYATLIWFLLDYNWTARSYLKNKNKSNTKHIKYESLVVAPRKTITNMCDFLEIKYEDRMLNSTGKSSSYMDINYSSNDMKRLNRWKNKINKIDFYIISVLTKKSRIFFGN
jgi:hypothetical protein